MRGDTLQPPRTRYPSRTHDVKREEVDTPGGLGSLSRAQTPGGKQGRGNNRFGNKGTEKCVHCRGLKRKCVFTDPDASCELCHLKSIPCGPKLKREQQDQLVPPPQRNLKQILAQPHWTIDEPLLPHIFAATAPIAEADVVNKLWQELAMHRSMDSFNDPFLPGDLPLPAVSEEFFTFPELATLETAYYPPQTLPQEPSYSTTINYHQPEPPPSYYFTPTQSSPASQSNTPVPPVTDSHLQYPRLPTAATQSLGNSLTEPGSPPNWSGDQSQSFAMAMDWAYTGRT